MNAFRRHLRAFVRIALMAMCGVAFLPTVAHALSRGGGHDQTQVCTAQGMQWVSADADRSVTDEPGTPSTGPLTHLDHCPCCATAAHAMAPPPVPLALPVPVLGAAAAPLFLQAPHTLHAWATAQPRGPPVRS